MITQKWTGRIMVSLGVLIALCSAHSASAQAVSPTTQPAAATSTTQPSTGDSATLLTGGNSPLALPSGGAGDLADLSLEDLMNVQVTSVSKSKQRLADAAASVTVINQEDIQRSGLHQIPELLRLVPGLFVQRGNQFTGWSVASRGFGALFDNKLLVLQDGRTLYTPLFSGVYWNTVAYPMPDIDRIEVIRGPGATRWGANAVNGVINITTKSAEDTQGIMLDSRVATDESDVAARYGGKIDADTYYRVYGMGSAFNDERTTDTTPGENNQFDDSRTGFRIDRLPNDKDVLTLQGDGFYQSASDELVTGHVLPDYSHDYRSGENVLGRWTHTESDTSDLSLQLYYDRVSLRDGYANFVGNTFDVDFQQHFELFKHNEVIYGLGARLVPDQVGTNSLNQPVVNPDHQDYTLFSGFVQDTWAIIPDRLHVIAGTKLERNSYTGVEVEPSARLLYTPSEETSFWTAVSRAVRTPSQLEWDDAVRITVPTTPGHFGQLNKTSLKPDSENEMAYELGYRQEINKSFSVDATGFVNIYRNLIGLESTGTTIDPALNPPVLINSTYANDQAARTYGTEVAAKWSVTNNWKLEGSYSLLVANVTDYAATITPNAAGIATSTPKNQAQLHSYLDITPKLQLNAGAYYVEQIGNGNVLQATGDAPGSYIRGDLGMTWKPIANLEVTAGVQNAFQPHHLESSFNAQYSSEVDRAFYAEVSWKY